MLFSFNWLKEFVDIRMKPAELASRLTMSGLEVESVKEAGGDAVLEVNITPNRGDCLSVAGLAREISAATGGKYAAPKPSPAKLKSASIKDFLSVEVKDKTRCLRYAARVVEGVKVGPSPYWLAKRLELSGVRPINNVVDATNYVMLETGQPFHAFDYRSIRGKKIIVDTPKGAEKFVTLDGIERTLSAEDLLIRDGGGAIALAGVMGGLNSEVKADTTTIVLESACFDPASVRKASKRLLLQSESSKRFERGVDPNSTVAYLDRLATLIAELTGGAVLKDAVDIYPKKIRPLMVKFSLKDANSLLGLNIKPDFAKRCFKSLGIGFSNGVCTVPTFRPDLTRHIDLVEELARFYGYDKIPVTFPCVKMSKVEMPASFEASRRAKEFLVAHGFCEALNYGFCSPKELEPFSKMKPVAIANPLGVEFSAMKTTLIPGLIQNLKLNISMGEESVRLFELRPVFLSQEEARLCGIVCGSASDFSWTSGKREVDFFDVKGVCQSLADWLGLGGVSFERQHEYGFLHPENSARITIDGRDAGFCGMIHPAVTAGADLKKDAYVFELKWSEWAVSAGKMKKFNPLGRFPSARRDVALLVAENVPSREISLAIEKFGSRIIKSSLVFDVYKGKGIPDGKKSVACAVAYFHSDRTLTDEEVNETHTKLVAFLKDKLGAEVR